MAGAGCLPIFARGGKAEAQYDLIVLDPPSFTRKKSGLKDALRGYRELHMRAFKLLSKDGLLATFSCSHHVSDEVFLPVDRRCAGRCAAFGQKVAAIRAGTRSSGPADNSRNGIFQRRSVGNDAGSLTLKHQIPSSNIQGNLKHQSST